MGGNPLGKHMNAKLCKKLRKLALIAVETSSLPSKTNYQAKKFRKKCLNRRGDKYITYEVYTAFLGPCSRKFYKKLKQTMGREDVTKPNKGSSGSDMEQAAIHKAAVSSDARISSV